MWQRLERCFWLLLLLSPFLAVVGCCVYFAALYIGGR